LGIVSAAWGRQREDGEGILRAFGVTRLDQELWNSEQDPARDRTGIFKRGGDSSPG